MANIKEQLGKRIREIRKRKSLTQEKLAELAGIETPSLSNIENGKNYPNHETLTKIASALSVKPYELYVFEDIVPKDEMIEEVTSGMLCDDTLAQRLYRFYICVK